MTQDIDIVIDNQVLAQELASFLQSLGESDFLFDTPSIRLAVVERGMFQLFDKIDALKLDLYPRELVPGELDRSAVVEVFANVHLPVASRADAAVSKLICISQGSHKSRSDVRAIVRAAPEADQRAIRELAAQLGLAALLDQVLGEPDEIR